MNINTVFPSKYLKSDELEGDVTYTIKTVEIETLGQGKDKEDKPIIYFKETEKGLACNKTNANIISGLYGNETDGWIGKQVTLFATEVQFGADMVMAIRVRMRKPATTSTTKSGDPVELAKREAWDAFKQKWDEYVKENPDEVPKRDERWKAALEEDFSGRDLKTLTAADWKGFTAHILADYSPAMGFIPM